MISWGFSSNILRCKKKNKNKKTNKKKTKKEKNTSFTKKGEFKRQTNPERNCKGFVKLPSNNGLPLWLRWLSVCLQHRRPDFNPWVGKIPWRRKWHPTPVLLPGKYHGQRSLVGYSP